MLMKRNKIITNRKQQIGKKLISNRGVNNSLCRHPYQRSIEYSGQPRAMVERALSATKNDEPKRNR
jgi:hypothetical protein